MFYDIESFDMTGDKRFIRYAHTRGHTDVCFSSDGKCIATCGLDGDVRLWTSFHDDDPTSHCVGENAYALAFSGSALLVSTDSNTIQSYRYPEFVKNGVLCNFTAPVIQIVTSPDGKIVVGGSWDMTVKVYDRTTSDVHTICGHNGPILGISLDPELKYVASSSGDGTIRVWSLDTMKCMKIWSCLPVNNSFSTGLCLGRTSWFPVSGKYIAVPDNNDIHLYLKDTWIESICFSTDSVSQPFSVTAFSPSGQYLAASTIAGDICVWNVSKNVCVRYLRHCQMTAICSLAWNPLDNGHLVYCDCEGQLGFEPFEFPKEEENSPLSPAGSAVCESDDTFENVISLRKIKESASTHLSDPELEGAAVVNDGGGGDDGDDDGDSRVSSAAAMYLQAPFQPSSTPVHLQHRFMVWNSVGIVRCHNAEDEENVIEVEFHESSLHHSMLLPNTTSSSIACVSEQILMLGSKADEYSKTRSKILCIIINSWDGTKNWSMDLPDGEDILAMACTNSWAAAATDVRNLRLFSVMGTQREVVCLPGPIVCLSGFEEMLLAVFHHGSALSFMLLAVLSNSLQSIISCELLPISPRAALQWAGFTDEGTLCTMDSAGIVRIFTNRGYWAPICNTNEKCSGASDRYFLLGVSEKYQNLRGILCKGSHYPPTVPHPTVVELPLQIPLCESANGINVLEEKWQRSQIFLDLHGHRIKGDEVHDKEKEEADEIIREALIKLFALACRSGLEQKAADLCKMMSSQQTLQMALKYATKLGKSNLVDRITDIAMQKTADPVPSKSQRVTSGSFSQRFGPFDLGAVRKNILAADKKKLVGEIDPFAPSPKVDSAKQNILLSVKDKITSISDTPPSGKPEKINPFKKISKPTNSPETQKENTTDNAVLSHPPVSLKVKLTGDVEKPSSTQPTAKTGSFVQWFEKEKVGLKEEFPNLSVSELTRLAMKRFRGKMSQAACGPIRDPKSAAAHSSNGENAESSSSDTRKRKVDEESSQDNTAASKLAKFAFKR